MPSTADLIAFTVTSLLIILIPGPSVVFAVGRTLALGRSAGLVTVASNAAGTTTWLIATALGLGSILGIFPALLPGIQVLGALYLGYLGIQTVRGSKSKHDQIMAQDQEKPSLTQIFREGFLVGLGNPKVAVFFLAILPQFINPDGNFIIQFLILGLIFEVVGTISDSGYVLGAAAVRQWILNSPSRLSRIIAVGGVMILGVAFWLLASTFEGI